MKHFGERLKKLRLDRGITQNTLAAHLGISYQAVSKWENNAGFPDIALLPAISNFFQVSSDYLLGIERDKKEEEIEVALNAARKFTHTGEIERSIQIIEKTLKFHPNEYRLLCDLIEYQVMNPRNDEKWLRNIEAKADLILQDCHTDSIRYKTIGNMVMAYSFNGNQEKALEIAQLLPDVAYSKKRLLSFAMPAQESINYKSDCILKSATILLTDILSVANYHISIGDAHIAVDICKRVLNIVDSIGAEGYLLYMQTRAYIHLVLAYSKLQETEAMYSSAEKALATCKEIEYTLSKGETPYTSPLLQGLTFSKENITFKSTQNSLERYYALLTTSILLKPYYNVERFINLIKELQKEIAIAKTHRI